MTVFHYTKRGALVAAVLFVVACGNGGAAVDEIEFDLWAQEGDTEQAFQYVESLAERYAEKNPDVTIHVVRKYPDELREEFQSASIAGAAPELLWTLNNHAGPFTAAGIVQPVGDLYSRDEFIEPVIMDGELYGIPISNENHLMLLYNRQLVDSAPQDTDEMIEIAGELTEGNRYGLAYNMTEPFWLVPWLGGFGGSVFAEDGITPTLDTPEMVATLHFLYDLTHVHEITPEEADYGTMDTLFREGNAAMIINGDWSLGEYRDHFGDDLGVAPIPTVSETGLEPAPYTSGKYFMMSDTVVGELREAIGEFIAWVLTEERQLEMADELTRLPGRLSALEHEQISGDPVLAGSAAAMANGIPNPAATEMRAIRDAMLPSQNAVLAGTVSPEDAAAEMQAVSETAIRAME